MSRSLPVSCVAAALFMAGGPVLAADLGGIRLLENDTGTRVVVNLQGAGDYKVFTLANPDRLVLDLAQSRLAPGFSLPAPNGAIANVRIGKPVPGTLRVVFDLGAPVSTKTRAERDGSATRVIVELSTHASMANAPRPMEMVSNPVPAGPMPIQVIGTADPSPAQTEAELLFARIAAVEPPRMALPLDPGPVEVAPMPALTVAVASPPVSRLLPPRPSSQRPLVSGTPAKAPAKTLHDVIGNGQRKLVVAIDAGHGGKDPGAQGPTGVREKAVTLAVARELARQINADPGMRAVLIRDNDSFVPLQQRYMKARAAQADLFISIHADASPNGSANGASVFVLSTRGASSQAARWLADKENAADLVGGVSLDQKDPNLAAVLLDLSQSATMRASDDIANQVLGSLKNIGKAHKPAIERANFVVLRSPDVPSMLIETGFITNPSEEQRLNDAGYRGRLASAIANGVRKYFSDQPPAGSWYASRQGDSLHGADSLTAPALASSPE